MHTAPHKRNKRNWWQSQDDTGDHRRRARWWTPDRYWTLLEGIEQGRSDAWIARQLNTTCNAVKLARKRAGISTRVPGVLNATEAAEILGIPCQKTVINWIKQGWLRSRRGRSTGHHQQWRITIDALQSFLANPEHWHRWDAERITDPILREWALTFEKPRYLTTREAAERLCVEHPTVHSWIQLGRIQAVRNGNWLIPEPALDGFIPLGQRERRRRHWSANDDHQIVTLCESGATFTEIARRLDRTVGTVVKRYERLTGSERAA